MAGVVHIDWYATVLRQEAFACRGRLQAPLALRYGATRYAVHRSRDDRYKVTQMAWFESKEDWYSYWEGVEMVEFRRRNAGHYQIPVSYVWHDEVVAGELGPEVGARARAGRAGAPAVPGAIESPPGRRPAALGRADKYRCATGLKVLSLPRRCHGRTRSST